MIPRIKYIEFIKSIPNLHLFQNPWWMDAVCGINGWDAVFASQEENPRSAFAFPKKKKFNQTVILMPMLCPGLAPAIQYPPGQKEQKKKVFEQEMIVELVQGLPPFGAFDICLLPHLENHLPFDRKNFSHKTRYTFRLEKQVSAETTFQEFSSSLRSQIRKAEKLVTISKSEDVQLLFKMSTCTFTRQGKKNPFSLRYLKQIYEACAQNNCGKILVASDQNKQVHAAIYIVWDTHCVYYLLGGGDEHFRSSGSYSLLLWKGIQWALKQNATFDFCGSMLPQVERFFRGFGGLQVPYFQITKFSPALKILLPVWKTLKGSI